MTDCGKGALEQALQFRFCADVAEQVRTRNSRDTSQPLGTHCVQKHERENAACYSLIGIYLSGTVV